jgi:hypothetical protein
MLNPDAEQLDAIVQQLLAASGPQLEEGDVLALEEGPDGVYTEPDDDDEEES